MKNVECKTEIAILLGVYNAEKYIREQLDSLLCQDSNNWTLFIRDDASSDNTRLILKEYCDNNSNFVLLNDELGNLGCNGNYYYLLSTVIAECYMFCNADDFWYKDKVRKTYESYKKMALLNINVPIIIHTDLSISDDSLNIYERSYWESVNTNPENFKSYNDLGICSFVAGATMLFNDKAKKLVFPVKESSMFFDQWIAMQVVRGGIICSIHEPTMIYRQIGTNLAAVTNRSQNKIMSKFRNFSEVLKRNRYEYKMLKDIEWGGFIKYVFFKAKVFLILRFGRKYLQIEYNDKNIPNKHRD